jgi:hypothetical protein
MAPLHSGTNYNQPSPPRTTQTNQPAGNGRTADGSGTGPGATPPAASGAAADGQFSAIPRRPSRSESPSDAAREPPARRPRSAPPTLAGSSRAGAATQPAPSWPAQQVSGSTRAMRLPRSLDDLPRWRQPLLDAAEGSLSRQFGERLRDLQESWATNRIGQATFEDRAYQIVEDLKEHENDLPYWDHHLANADVGLQYVRSSAEADRRATTDLIRSAIVGPAGDAVEAGENVQVVAQRYGIVDPAGIRALETVATLGPARDAAQAGENVQVVAQRLGIVDPRQISTLETFAIDGPAGAAVRAGENVQVVAQRHGIVHPGQIVRLDAMADAATSS